MNVDKSLSQINEDIESLKKSLNEMLENSTSKEDFKVKKIQFSFKFLYIFVKSMKIDLIIYFQSHLKIY